MDEKIDVLTKAVENHYLVESLNASVSKHLLDEHFTLIAANSQYYEMFGYEKEEYVRLFHNRPDLFYAKDPASWEEMSNIVLDTIKKGGNRYTYIGRMRHKDGRKLWIRLVGTFLDEYVNGYQISYSVMMDITDMMQNKIEKDVIQNNYPGLVAKYRVTKTGFEFIEGNQKFYDMFWGIKSYVLSDLSSNDDLREVYDKYDMLIKGEPCTFSVACKDRNGQQKYLHANAECVNSIDDDPVYLLLLNDVTELILQNRKLKEYNASMHKLAYSDEITGGFNRRKFDQIAGENIEAANAGDYCVIWLNLQNFKLINETAGVENGDRTLKFIYEKIHSNLHIDECVARLFSDNFAILMKESEHARIEERLHEIVSQINAFNHGMEFKYYLAFTAGIYHAFDKSRSITAMEDRAHTARKNGTGNHSDLCICSFFTDEVQSRLIKEKNLENAMWESLRKKEFEMYLQPKYSLKSKKIYGAEALARWNHPQLGFLSPAEFIPLFEKNGFIVDLDLYIYECVCKLLQKRLKEGKKVFPISVNMSRVHLIKPNFLDEYIHIRKQYEVPSQYLELELTETMVFENPVAFHAIIQKIHDAGFSCSMDDFGSGYSSLNMLKDLKLDIVKLDGAFFSSKFMDNEKENIIVKSIIDMTKALHMEVVAEGIETLQQMNFLDETPCDFIQGYIISKPVPLIKFEEMIQQQEEDNDTV